VAFLCAAKTIDGVLLVGYNIPPEINRCCPKFEFHKKEIAFYHGQRAF